MTPGSWHKFVNRLSRREAAAEHSQEVDRTRVADSLRPFASLWAGLLVLLLVGPMLVGCKTAPTTSRIAVEDYQAMAAEMSESLRHSDAIEGRSSASAPMVISFEKVRNLSSEIMPSGEQWAVVAMVRSAQPIRRLWDDKRIVFVIPARHTIDQRDTIDAERADKGFGTERAVTHTITATFRSVTRAQSDRRVDVYACQFEMIDIQSGATVWIDEFNFQRTAHGDVRD